MHPGLFLKRFKFLFSEGHFLKNSFYLKHIDAEVLKALSLSNKIDGNFHLKEEFSYSLNISIEPQITSQELFNWEGRSLPCVLEGDSDLLDNWLNASNNYPLYYNVFSALNKASKKVRMLEIGVRSGYIGVVFCKALEGNTFYYGLDPNIYVKNGLEFAHKSFTALKQKFTQAEFVLQLGFSSALDTQLALKLNEKFDLIHIDGDHTLLGKLIDLKLSKELIAPEGTIIVDDYDNHNIVKQAIELAFRIGWFSKFQYLPSFRGMALIK